MTGEEKLPAKGKGALLVGLHTTHNADIPVCLTGMYAATGRAERALLHRVVYLAN
eukprot:gene6748-65505_t